MSPNWSLCSVLTGVFRPNDSDGAHILRFDDISYLKTAWQVSQDLLQLKTAEMQNSAFQLITALLESHSENASILKLGNIKQREI